MRCYICDKQLTDKEVNYNEQTGKYEPCSECLDIITDTAFPSGVELFNKILGEEDSA